MRCKAGGHASQAIFERHFRCLPALNGVEELHMLEIRGSVVESVVLDRVIPDLANFDFWLGGVVGPLLEITHRTSLAVTEFERR